MAVTQTSSRHRNVEIFVPQDNSLQTIQFGYTKLRKFLGRRIIKNETARRVLGLKLLDNYRETRLAENGLNYGTAEARKSCALFLAEKGVQKPHLARMIVNQLAKYPDPDVADDLVSAFCRIYPTLTQKQRARVFKKLVNKFIAITKTDYCMEKSAVMLAVLFKHIGQNSKTIYREDEGKLFDRNAKKLTERLTDIIRKERGYEDYTGLRLVCSYYFYAVYKANTDYMAKTHGNRQEHTEAKRELLEFLENRFKNKQQSIAGFGLEKLAEMPEARKIYANSSGYCLAVISQMTSISDNLKRFIKEMFACNEPEVRRRAVEVARIGIELEFNIR